MTQVVEKMIPHMRFKSNIHGLDLSPSYTNTLKKEVKCLGIIVIKDTSPARKVDIIQR